MKWPTLQGIVIDFNHTDIKLNEPVSVTLSNINEHDIGCMKISYRNACFNSYGFLTHDTHILLD